MLRSGLSIQKKVVKQLIINKVAGWEWFEDEGGGYNVFLGGEAFFIRAMPTLVAINIHSNFGYSKRIYTKSSHFSKKLVKHLEGKKVNDISFKKDLHLLKKYSRLLLNEQIVPEKH